MTTPEDRTNARIRDAIAHALKSDQAERCKHCGETVARDANASGDYMHTSGQQSGMHRCAVTPYGYHAEPIGTPCNAAQPNPCRGAQFASVTTGAPSDAPQRHTGRA